MSAAIEPFDRTAMWMSSPLHTRPLFSFFLHDFPTSRPKRDLLLCVARHTAVTLTRNAPLFRAQSPGISVSRVEPSGVFFSRFCQSSSRSLGRCLLLGQRSRMNLFSHLIRSLFHQDHRNPYTSAYARPLQWRLWKRPRAGVCGKPSGKTPAAHRPVGSPTTTPG